MRDLLTLNVFTNGFNGFTSSTGVGYPDHVRLVYSKNPFDGVTIFEESAMFIQNVAEIKSKYKIGWLSEGRSIHPEHYAEAWEKRTLFDYIFTYDEYLLALEPTRFKLCPRGSIYVPQSEWGLRPKSKGVALICSRKYSAPGHILRHLVAEKFKERIDVYGRTEYADKRKILPDYRFALAIEGENSRSMFDGQLLEAVALGCVPIFWGCPNIGEFLDVDGILRFQTLDELDALLKEATPDKYAEMLPALQRNLARLPEYRLAEDWMYEHLLKGLQ
jgi:hypothetical protein